MSFSAAQLARLIEQRYPIAKGWLTLKEVDPPAVENEKARRIDVASLGLYRSNCEQLHGFEIKVSRADWQAELDDPSKAEPGIRATTHWWLVAPKGSVITDAKELPPGWGWLAPNSKGTGLRRQRDATASPADPGWFEYRALTRMAFRHPGELREARDEGYEAGYGAAKERFDDPERNVELTEEQEELIRVGKRALEIEAKLGVKLRTLTRVQADAVKLVDSVLKSKFSWSDLDTTLKRSAGDAREAHRLLTALRRVGADLVREGLGGNG